MSRRLRSALGRVGRPSVARTRALSVARTMGLAATLAVAALGACTVAGPRPGSPPVERAEGPREEPAVRIGVVVAVPSVQLDGTSRVQVSDPGGRVLVEGAGPWTVERSGDAVRLTGPDGERATAPSLVARPDGGTVRVDGTGYRGAVLVQPAENGVTAVNLVELERYLLGVVPLEIGAGRPADELEAVKAQAIAARTYAIRHMGRREAHGFDLYGTVQDQVYGGADAEDETTSRAVRETRGEILVHDGEPIEAYYHSTCGGRTAALEEVWNGPPRPYLESVSDRRRGGGWYCETSNRFRWTEQWDAEALRGTLTRAYRARGVDGTVTDVDGLEVTGRTRSGRAEAVRVRTNLGEMVVAGDSIRWLLRPSPDRILNSAAIELDTHGDDGRALVVEGAGWGHGIGMCQIGALGRARDGHSYREILGTYYPGSRIARLY